MTTMASTTSELTGFRPHIGVVGPVSVHKFARDLGTESAVLPTGFPGTTTPVDIVIRSMLDLGLRVSAVTLDPQITAGSAQRFAGELLEVVIGHYRSRRRARNFFADERRVIRDSLRDCAPDVVNAHWSYEFALGAIDSGLPTLVTVHDVPMEIFRLQPSMYRLVRWLMHKQAMRRAQLVGFNSPYTRDRLRVRDRSLPILPYGLEDAEWRFSDRSCPSPARPRYVSVNNGFSRRKNVKCLLQAHAAIRRDRPGARLTLIGGEYEQDGPAMRWAEVEGVADNVEFLGPQSYDDTMSLVKASDVLVHASLEESFGLTLIEAARVGTPVIAGVHSGAVPWVLDNGAAGVLTDVSSATTIAKAMTEIVDDGDAWAALRARAFLSARDRFSAGEMAKRYLAALQQTVTAHSAKTRGPTNE